MLYKGFGLRVEGVRVGGLSIQGFEDEDSRFRVSCFELTAKKGLLFWVASACRKHVRGPAP